MVSARSHASVTDDSIREAEATIAVLIAEELVAQHELGAHPDPVADCPTCRAHARSGVRATPAGHRDRTLPFGA
jgi:hypothetical protein